MRSPRPAAIHGSTPTCPGRRPGFFCSFAQLGTLTATMHVMGSLHSLVKLARVGWGGVGE